MLESPVSVVIPVLDEACNIPHTVFWIPANAYEIILVDGFSMDDTVAFARQVWPDVRAVTQRRQGKGMFLHADLSSMPAHLQIRDRVTT